MRYVYDHDLHIHSQLSICSNDPEQSAERILKYALDNGLHKICVTDHFWDDEIEGATDWYKKQNFEWISQILPLPKAEGVQFLFGAETEMDKNLTIGLGKRYFDVFDFIIVPTTHLKNPGFSLTEVEAQSVEGRRDAWLRKLEGLVYSDMPFHKTGAAHLACCLISKKREEVLAVLDSLPERELKRLFTRAADVGVAIELNSTDMGFNEGEAATVLRPFEIARSCGCKFYLGSDAHHPNRLENVKAIFERAIDYLGLRESDKHEIAKRK